MRDKYARFADLAAFEPKDAYAITLQDRGTSIALIAPHGGSIEPGTSEVARAIAGNDYSFYLFEGVKGRVNDELHITSTNFDEPKCESLLRSTTLPVTIHGERGSSETIYLGGGAEAAVETMRTVLAQNGFRVREHSNSSLRGLDKRNICNRGTGGAGVQFELSRGLRESFFQSLSRAGREKPRPALSHFSATVRKALSQIGL